VVRAVVVRRVALVAIAAAILAGGATAATPVYIPPSPTKVCAGLPFCFGITGPWVVVPAKGEATFLLDCPVRAASRSAFLIGGADSLASAGSIRVWYDGNLATPIGSPTSTVNGLLFHAVANNGKRGSFQPILGCIDLRQASKRSTVSARAASAPPRAPHAAPTPTPRSRLLVLEPGWSRTLTVSCLRRETLVGTWDAYAFGTETPPVLPPPAAVRIRTAQFGRNVTASIRTSASIPHLIEVQVGALCER
jgi:hypothetical protein